MNWNVVSAISEVVGVIVIVISLLYLAFQIRFARLAAADTSRMARVIGVREIDRLFWVVSQASNSNSYGKTRAVAF